MTAFQRKLIIGLCIMAVLSPLGIILPEKFHSGNAWGEWGVDAVEKALGFVPEGMKRTADIWKSPAPDYNFGGDKALFSTKIFSYVLSGLMGIIGTSAIVYLIAKAFHNRK